MNLANPKVAFSLAKPVMSSDWVEEAWKSSSPSSSRNLPIFLDCVICVTGLAPDARRAIEQNTKKYGGKYSGELHEKVTHLISVKPEGKKYEYAIQNNIKVVDPLWHTDCVERCGQVNPSETQYQLDGEPVASSASAKGKRKGKDKATGKGAAKSSSEAVPDGAKTSESESSLDVKHDPNNSYLDGCRVYLHGFRGDRLQLMVKIIRAAGGTKYTALDDRVTHVVFPGGNLPMPLEQQCLDFPTVPQIVIDSWLVACAKASALVPTREHVPEKLRPPPTPAPVTHRAGAAVSASAAAAAAAAAPAAAATASGTGAAATTDGNGAHVTAPNDSDLDFTSMFDGDWGEDGTAGEIKSPNPATRAHARATEQQQRQQQQQLAEYENDDDEHEPVERDRRRTCRSRLFKGFKIATVSPSPEITTINLQHRICQHGGEFVESIDAANCILVSLLTTNAATTPSASSECRVATFKWLDFCMADVKLYDPLSSFLFHPCPMPTSTRSFRRAHICTSGFDEHAKAAIESLCTSVGATFTQKFKRKANSHLICMNASGQKYTKSLQWNVPAVRQDWLFDSVQQGRLLNTADYLVTDPLPQNQQLRETVRAEFWSVVAEATASTLTDSPQFRPQFRVDAFMGALETPKAVSDRKKIAEFPSSKKGAAGEDDSGALSDLFSSGLAQANHRLRDTSAILKGTVLFIAKKLQKRPQDLVVIATQLGATISSKLDESCTHFVFKGRTHDSSKEYKKAKGKCHVVAPEWLTETLQASMRQVEADFPHTFNPKRSLGGVSSSRKSHATRQSPATPFDKAANSAKKPRFLNPTTPQMIISEHEGGAEHSSLSSTTNAAAAGVGKSGSDESMLKSAVEAFISNHRATNKVPPRRSRLVSAGDSSPRASKELSSSANVCSISAMERTGSSSRKSSIQAPEQDASNQNTEDDVSMLFHSAGSRELYDSQSPSNEPEEEYSQAAVVYDDPDRDERQRMIAQLQLDNGEEVDAEDRLDANAGTAADDLVATEALSPTASTRNAAAGKGKRKVMATDATGSNNGARGKRKRAASAAVDAGLDVHDEEEDAAAAEVGEAAVDTPLARDPSEYRILLSALDVATKHELTTLIRKLGGTILESRKWDTACTCAFLFLCLLVVGFFCKSLPDVKLQHRAKMMLRFRALC